MDIAPQHAARIVIVALVSLVVTQAIYFTLYSSHAEINRPLIWGFEAAAYLAIAVCALTGLARGTGPGAGWAAIAISGVLNAVQIGMGLTLFGPLHAAGEALAPVYDAVVAGAFYLYFAGRALFGFAALLFGLGAWRAGGGAAKALGGLAMLAGLAALALNLPAMALGMDLLLPAGASGTLAMLLLALVIGQVAVGEVASGQRAAG